MTESTPGEVGHRPMEGIRLWHRLGALFALAICCAGANGAEPPIIGKRTTRNLSGWALHIDTRLLADQSQITERAILLLSQQLDEIVRVVPTQAVAQLRKVPLYFSPEYPDTQPRAEYHPSADWLQNHRRDPAMARGIEFTNIRIFGQEMSRMPNFALHELAHAYHHRVLRLGFGNPEIRAAYEKAKASGRYDNVLRRHGSGRPDTHEPAYALTTPQEYFAETSEAFFSRNDFFPFTAEELQRHDPEMFVLLGRLWGAK